MGMFLVKIPKFRRQYKVYRGRQLTIKCCKKGIGKEGNLGWHIWK